MDEPERETEREPEREPEPANDAPVDAAPRTHLVGSLLAAALLFLPTGLIAVFLAWRAGVWIGRGDYPRARRFSRAALIVMIVTVVLGVLVYTALVGALLALGAFSGG